MTAEPTLTAEKAEDEQQPQDILGPNKAFDGNDLFNKIFAGFCIPQSHHANDFDDGEETTSNTTPTEISVPVDHVLMPADDDNIKKTPSTDELTTTEEEVEVVLTTTTATAEDTAASKTQEEEEEEEDVKVTSRDLADLSEEPLVAATKYQKSLRHLAIAGFVMLAIVALGIGFMVSDFVLEPKWSIQELKLHNRDVVKQPASSTIDLHTEPLASDVDVPEASAVEEAEEEEQPEPVVQTVTVEDENDAEDQAQEEEKQADESAEESDEPQAEGDISDLGEIGEIVPENSALGEDDILDLDEIDESVADNESVEAVVLESATEQVASAEHEDISEDEGDEEVVSTEEEPKGEEEAVTTDETPEGDEEPMTTDKPDDAIKTLPEDTTTGENLPKRFWGRPKKGQAPAVEALVY